jgi:uncharacterized protein (DUF2267 family)
MEYERFVTLVGQGTGAGRERAERAIHATLQTLAERIAAGEARDLAGRLPPDVAPWLATISDAAGFDRDEFLRRVAEREGVDMVTAERDTRAVFTALGQAITPKELDDLAAELSKDFDPLLPRGHQIDVMTAERFVQRVAERAGVDPQRAWHATEAVLETLSERIAGGEVEDLIARLPLELHGALRRGLARTAGKPVRMSLDDFIARVGEREGVDIAGAREHARAVFATLREAAGDDEFFDITDQLPGEYRAIAARARR